MAKTTPKAPELNYRDVLDRWLQHHAEGWSDKGLGATAEGYALTVAQQRTGRRSGLSFDASLSSTGKRDGTNRKLIREQVDAVIEEMRS